MTLSCAHLPYLFRKETLSELLIHVGVCAIVDDTVIAVGEVRDFEFVWSNATTYEDIY
jgi:hypothetical protein